MKTQIENTEKNKAKLTIHFEPKESRKAYNIVLKEIAKEADIPGFRKGKIPLSIIEERVGKQGVEMEAIKKLVEDHLPKVIEEEKIELLTTPQLENQEFETFDEVKLTIGLETRPSVELPKYKELEFTIPEAKPEDVTPESLVEDLAKRVSPWKDASEDATAELGNLLTFDFAGEFLDGSDMPDKEGKDMRVVAEKDNFAPGVIEELVGMKVGENKTIKSTFPKDYDDEAFAGKEANFKVTLKKIEQQDLMPINDDLAKIFGKQNLDELKEMTKEQIETTRKTMQRTRSQAFVLSKILEESKADLPAWLIERESESKLSQIKHQHDHQHQHAEGEECNHDIPEKPTDEMKESAENRLKFNLVLSQIAKEEKIQLEQNELMGYLQYYHQMRKQQTGNEDKFTPEEVNRISEELLFEKITDWLIKESKIEFVEENDENLKTLETVEKSFKKFLEQ